MNEIEKAIEMIHNVSEVIIDEISDTYIDECAAYSSAINLAIQALQEKAEMDKMRCANCEHFYKLHCIFEGLCNKRKLTDFCSYFEPKESEGKNGAKSSK